MKRNDLPAHLCLFWSSSSDFAFRWKTRLFTVLFFREIVEIERILPLMEAILIFKYTKGAGVGDYSSRGRGRENIFLASSQTVPHPLSCFHTVPQVRLGTFEIKMADNNSKTSSVSTIPRKSGGLQTV